MRRAEIPWLKRGNAKQKNWKNTVLGFIRIEGKRLNARLTPSNARGRSAR